MQDQDPPKRPQPGEPGYLKHRRSTARAVKGTARYEKEKKRAHHAFMTRFYMGKENTERYCEACGWGLPEITAYLVEIGVPNAMTKIPLDIHHVIPIEVGGQNEDENKALLCANCHRLAHFLTRVTRRSGKPQLEPDAIVDKSELLEALKTLQESPAAWLKTKKAEREKTRVDQARAILQQIRDPTPEE